MFASSGDYPCAFWGRAAAAGAAARAMQPCVAGARLAQLFSFLTPPHTPPRCSADEKTPVETLRFLTGLVRDGTIELTDGGYSVKG